MSRPIRTAVIHGHFYQPPREDPWIEEVPRQPSAAPFHDWNVRITHECYQAVTAARVPAENGRIATIVNTLNSMSFNFGPTLLDWLEREAPDVYAAVLEADRQSAAVKHGHGNAIAQPYHHTILPLATHRDKVTEVRWGIADFRRRFGREPEGMWLPETAVDDETLEVLALEGVKFTVLAPHQVRTPPPRGLPGRYLTPSGKTIAVFVYDGPISHDIAFGDLTRNAVRWEERMREDHAARLVSVATDGETFGHHHRFGEMALAAVLSRLEQAGVRVQNFASYLARHAPKHDVDIVAPSSWSCSHGVERWRSECGCGLPNEDASRLAWRAVLRDGLDWLATEVHAEFEEQGRRVFTDPWQTRDDYGTAVSLGNQAVVDFVRARCTSEDADERIRAAELLDMERNALRMFTSCGWFFDDIGRIESQQVLRYAARAIELAGTRTPELDSEFRRRLESAASHDPKLGTGADIYDALRPDIPPAVLTAAGYAAVRAIGAEPEAAVPKAFRVIEDQSDLVVTRARTGRAVRLRAVAARPGLAQLAVKVAGVDEPIGAEVGLDTLPERARLTVTRALCRATIDTWFTEAERADLCAGEDFHTVATRALRRSVETLRDDRADHAVQQVYDLLELFDLMRWTFPFEIQTLLHTIHESTGDLATVARRIGFA